MPDIDIDEIILDLGRNALNGLKNSYNNFKSVINGVTINNSELTTAPLLEDSKKLVNNFFSPLDYIWNNIQNICSIIEESFSNILFKNIIHLEDKKNGGTRVMPLYDQTDYPNVPYGGGTIATSGCGITSLAMVASYFTGKMWKPDECAALATKIEGHESSNVGRMLTAADKIGLSYTQGTEKDIMNSLKQGKVVIALVNDSTHFVVLKGLTEDGKVLVNDPYGPYQDAKDFEGHTLTYSEWGYMQPNDINITAGRVWIFDGTKSERFAITDNSVTV